MNHLDIGFDGINPTIGYAINVINKYFDVYFPKAIEVASQLRNKGKNERLIYTTHSWLVSVYLDCSNSNIPFLQEINVQLHCPNKTELDNFIKAIERGDITWHAFPFNSEAELLDSLFFLHGINITHQLDKTFGKPFKNTMSQRDVPGTTRSIVPLLKQAGIKALSIGVNGGSAPPDVPKAFIWKDINTNTDIIGMLHPGGYGGISIDDCVIVDGFDHALAFAFRGDNQGPPDVNEVIQNFKTLQQEFPNAKIFASTFDNFVNNLEKVKSTLPIITKEMGDTWLFGVASDPLKLAQFREVQRLRSKCLNEGKCKIDELKIFDRLLIKVVEHTWGLDVKTFLNDWINWSNKNFNNVKNNKNYLLMVNSWIEQRKYIYNAIQSLGNHPLAYEIQDAFSKMKPQLPSTDGFELIKNISTIFKMENLEIGFNSKTGSISHLIFNKNNQQIIWATKEHPIAQFMYETYSGQDVLDFLNNYLYINPHDKNSQWAFMDFGKPNVSSSASSVHKTWYPTLISLWKKEVNNKNWKFLLEMKMNDPSTYILYGSPEIIWIEFEIIINNLSLEPKISINTKLLLFNKTSTRLPEALWFLFNPIIQDEGSWLMDKMGFLVSPFDIMINGSFHQHGIQKGIKYMNNQKKNILEIESKDAAVVVPGIPTAYPTPLNSYKFQSNYDNSTINQFSFCLYNNLWGTNYIMWYPYLTEDKDLFFRFIINFY